MAFVVDAIEPNWTALIVFAAVWGVGCAGLFYLIGILPLSAAPAEVRRGAGPMLVLTSVGLVGALLVFSLLFAFAELRWTSLVVAGGMVFLFSPFVIQDLPEKLKDNKAGLSIVLVLTLAGLFLLYFVDGVASVRSMFA
ncbi:hypothetical protein [Dichotomicrobium thermohalophilum]|uniref:Uncharacterized protein n=1 Tax=Dichotomicrobium thermohalophilum TaxID=933063 RepID=A0A397PNQ4_9HYPH|nr:hypothetical protein [Dichotomicrobium thermohalophilum]RIA47664.1 hypothetical protein BXY53_2226 [Dichotomicrobium thermohalophilum]